MRRRRGASAGDIQSARTPLPEPRCPLPQLEALQLPTARGHLTRWKNKSRAALRSGDGGRIRPRGQGHSAPFGNELVELISSFGRSLFVFLSVWPGRGGRGRGAQSGGIIENNGPSGMDGNGEAVQHGSMGLSRVHCQVSSSLSGRARCDLGTQSHLGHTPSIFEVMFYLRSLGIWGL